MKKKVLKITAITLLVLLAIIIAVPLFLQGKIEEIIKTKVNNSINATLDFEKADLSLLRSFPNANVALTKLSLVNKAPFEGDTLFSSSEIALAMSIKELFKSADEPIVIKTLNIDGAKLHIKADAEGNANYDIAKESEETASTTSEASSNNFTLNMDSYAITNSQIIYEDLASGMILDISEMNHSGTGDLSLEKSELKTLTDALVSFEMDSTRYLNKNKINLDALIGIDLSENKYTFLENKAMINQLPLVFDGFVKVNEDNQEVDITFETPSSDFKNFLAVIPEAYASNIENVQTTGNFEVRGEFKGVVDDEHIPTFKIAINSDNASFKYPDLPKSVRNVYIDTEINNETGITEDTYVNINRLSFLIDEDKFNLNAKIRELMGNTKVNAHMDGKINLANISKAYPVPDDYNLKGILSADVTTAFDMASLEKKQYQNTKTSGKASVSGFEYASEELKNPVTINTAAVTFNPNTVTLNSFKGRTGSTDFDAKGTLTNLLGFMFNNENIEGNFTLASNQFALNDFMVEETEAVETEGSEEEKSAPTGEERIKIPSFLDCTIEAVANTVVYDNLNLKNVKGTLVIKDETATVKNLTSDLFGGTLGLSGSVSTKQEASTFDMSLGMNNFNIGESFAGLELFKVLTPLASALNGKLNSDIKISGNLQDDFTPNLATISGNLLAELLNPTVDTQKAPLVSALDSKLSFLNTKEINLDGLKTALTFDNGSVKVKPFTLNYKDIAIDVNGSHSFDKQMNYSATLNVPAKYLGSEVNKLIAQLNDDSVGEVTVPVTANIGGNFTNPSVSTDLTSSVKTLTAKLVEMQKQKLINKGKDKAKDLLSDAFKKDETDTTSTKSGGVKEAIGNILGDKKDTSATDSTKAKKEDEVKDAAKSILGGLLGKKKKDTVNQ
ncbi:AsmA-like C-terminal region-containing protein [Flagellimonas halotolerans]|uniref:AsmA-like C-terminal region-containing protein n=1 Tax=Flagellimonas halotolerans TaxID=3112164 RepID=A0ABU6IU65_9FLAO|nr:MULTISPECIES: AsmA-like C-terminal region-containing protein [unclassified Allomuricauda]MEC3966801.1 AsmA-like C-terminal region-containing protein [Muricauda sp. SYSU M86414]MEC4266683.1 AsmA-like C-terminal region-containing protein [Muricauda sp. SYSU M84420]